MGDKLNVGLIGYGFACQDIKGRRVGDGLFRYQTALCGWTARHSEVVQTESRTPLGEGTARRSQAPMPPITKMYMMP
jgi:hypothetical protein